MKIKVFKIESGMVHDPKLEEMLNHRDNSLKEMARKDAIHFAKRNLPANTGDDISQYTGVYRASYEKLATDVLHYLQPASLHPETGIEEEYLSKQLGSIDTKTKELEDQNRIDEFELPELNKSGVPTRIFWALILTFIITVGETVFNTKAFQVIVENMLFALLLSICVSLAVFSFAHISPFLYKGAKTRLQRILVVVGSLSLVIGLFIALSFLRTNYLEHHKVYISPSYFVIINLFFFIVSALISLFILPEWSEVKDYAMYLHKERRSKKRNRIILRLRKQKEELLKIKRDNDIIRSRISEHANYSLNRIRKMFWETFETFKVTNLQYRTDGKTPDCFGAIQIEPDIKPLANIVLITKAELS